MSDNALGSSTAVEKQVDQMEILATTFVVPVFIVLLAAADITKDFELFGFHLALKDAFGKVAAIFDCLLLLFCTSCWKAGDLLKGCRGEHVNRAVIAIVTHKWLLNPFSYSGDGLLSAATCSVGGALLTLTWWGGLCGLKLLSSVTTDMGVLEKCLYALYFVLGAAALGGVVRLTRMIVRLTEQSLEGSDNEPMRPRSLKRSIAVKSGFSIIATILGYWLFYSFAHVA